MSATVYIWDEPYGPSTVVLRTSAPALPAAAPHAIPYRPRIEERFRPRIHTTRIDLIVTVKTSSEIGTSSLEELVVDVRSENYFEFPPILQDWLLDI